MSNLTPEQLEQRKATNMKILKFGCLPIVVLFLLVILFSTLSESDKQNDSASSRSATETPSGEAAKPIYWKYGENVDKMEGTKVYYAQCESTNEIEFDFPYNGGSKFHITIRNQGKRNEIFLKVSSGQFMTSIGGASTVKVKFDDNKSLNYSYSSADDGSADVIFIDNAPSFLTKLKASKKLMIEATFYDAGNKIIEFDTEGLQWDH